jgi:hypothetical protein
MQRVHLVELEDLPWLPTAVRDGGTDVLDFFFARIGFYRALVPELVAMMDTVGTRRLVDLCSGGGGGALAMRALLREQGHAGLALVLTDRFPSAAAAARVEALGDHGVLVPLLAVPNMVMLFTVCVLLVPFVRPFRLTRALLTYLIPAIPLLFAWDGMVSGLRAYTPEELLALATAVPGSERYTWKATRGGTALCLLGYPAR